MIKKIRKWLETIKENKGKNTINKYKEQVEQILSNSHYKIYDAIQECINKYGQSESYNLTLLRITEIVVLCKRINQLGFLQISEDYRSEAISLNITFSYNNLLFTLKCINRESGLYRIIVKDKNFAGDIDDVFRLLNEITLYLESNS